MTKHRYHESEYDDLYDFDYLMDKSKSKRTRLHVSKDSTVRLPAIDQADQGSQSMHSLVVEDRRNAALITTDRRVRQLRQQVDSCPRDEPFIEKKGQHGNCKGTTGMLPPICEHARGSTPNNQFRSPRGSTPQLSRQTRLSTPCHCTQARNSTPSNCEVVPSHSTFIYTTHNLDNLETVPSYLTHTWDSTPSYPTQVIGAIPNQFIHNREIAPSQRPVFNHTKTSNFLQPIKDWDREYKMFMKSGLFDPSKDPRVKAYEERQRIKLKGLHGGDKTNNNEYSSEPASCPPGGALEHQTEADGCKRTTAPTDKHEDEGNKRRPTGGVDIELDSGLCDRFFQTIPSQVKPNMGKRPKAANPSNTRRRIKYLQDAYKAPQSRDKNPVESEIQKTEEMQKAIDNLHRDMEGALRQTTLSGACDKVASLVAETSYRPSTGRRLHSAAASDDTITSQDQNQVHVVRKCFKSKVGQSSMHKQTENGKDESGVPQKIRNEIKMY